MKCKNCGHEFESGTFCPECGHKFKSEDLTAENNSQDTEGNDANFDTPSSEKKKIPWYLNGFFILLVFYFIKIPGIILCIIRLIKYKERRKIIIIATAFVTLISFVDSPSNDHQIGKDPGGQTKKEIDNEINYSSEINIEQESGIMEHSEVMSDESDFYTPITFSYNNKKAVKLIDLYEKALKHQDDLIYIQPDKVVSDYALSYKQSIEWSEYLYYGDIKNGKPDGRGLIFKDSLIICMGNFTKGSLNGYGIRFSENSEIGILYEGEWKDGKYNGNGIEYNIFYNENILNQIRRYYDEQRELNENLETDYGHQAAINMKCIIDKPFPPAWISYEGSFKKGNKSGIGKEYYYDLDWDTDVYVDRDMADIYVDMDMDKVYLGYEGEFKENRFDGKGTLYYPPGNQVQYKGEFKEGEYNGKGTLYNQDGSVNHKGKFKNGEIK